jgi:signal transduction histidine kinase
VTNASYVETSRGSAEDHCIRGFLHDLQQPITTMVLLLSLAEQSIELGECERAKLRVITEQARAAQQLISAALSGVVTDAPPERARFVREPRVQRVLLAEQVAALIAPMQQIHDERLVFRADEDCEVLIDLVSLRRIVENLLNNALRASDPGGRVEVTVSRSGDHAQLSIDDSGPGFGRIRPGAGIGLLSSISTVIERSGKVRLEQSDLGGARVSVLLPVVAP